MQCSRHSSLRKAQKRRRWRWREGSRRQIAETSSLLLRLTTGLGGFYSSVHLFCPYNLFKQVYLPLFNGFESRERKCKQTQVSNCLLLLGPISKHKRNICFGLKEICGVQHFILKCHKTNSHGIIQAFCWN